jgi:hypothetical protein
MRRLFAVMCLAMLGLVACGGGEQQSETSANATLAPVPAEYAGLTNPLGSEAGEPGAEVFHTNCEMCHGPKGHGEARESRSNPGESRGRLPVLAHPRRQAGYVHGGLEGDSVRRTNLADNYLHPHTKVA